jgi:hypothetical protein
MFIGEGSVDNNYSIVLTIELKKNRENFNNKKSLCFIVIFLSLSINDISNFIHLNII